MKKKLILARALYDISMLNSYHSEAQEAINIATDTLQQLNLHQHDWDEPWGKPNEFYCLKCNRRQDDTGTYDHELDKVVHNSCRII
jgi:hypothetical protein